VWAVRGRRQTATECWWGNEEERERLEGLVVDDRIIIKWALKEIGRGRGLY